MSLLKILKYAFINIFLSVFIGGILILLYKNNIITNIYIQIIALIGAFLFTIKISNILQNYEKNNN